MTQPSLRVGGHAVWPLFVLRSEIVTALHLLTLAAVIMVVAVVRVSAQDTPVADNPKRGTTTTAADWPRFRGPNGTGISHATTVPVKWGAEDYNWATRLPGHGHGSPVVVGERVYLVCGEKRTAERIVVCVDVTSGKVLWKRNFTSKKHRLHNANSYGSSTPAADAHGVVVTWADPDKLMLLALDREGQTLWQRNFGPHKAINGAGTSPIIVGDLVVLMNVQMDPNFMIRIGVLPKNYPDKTKHDSFLVAVDRKSGKTVWKVKRETYLAGYSTPCLRTLKNGQLELVFLDSYYGLTGVALRTGVVNWQTSRLLPSRTVASPVMAGDLIFGSHGRGVSGDVIYAVRAGGKSEKPKVAYEIKKAAPLTPTPIVKDGLAYLWSDGGIVTCIVASSGEVVWRERVGGSYYGSPVWVSQALYCVDRRGTVAVVAAGKKYELLGKVPLGEPSFATPAVAGGVMYFRTESRLLSLGGPKTTR
ncbi:MAG: PQQ-binding-like beta-propeller repeat protein [Planctomycetota bacterium]|nr:PQQ-binding-like beta-propeller repeat protein [Planctomycetota bacterium]